MVEVLNKLVCAREMDEKEIEQHWTCDLAVTPKVTHNLIEMYFCAENTVACKHKREGYQLFKNGYVKIMRFIPDMKADGNTYCYIKC